LQTSRPPAFAPSSHFGIAFAPSPHYPTSAQPRHFKEYPTIPSSCVPLATGSGGPDYDDRAAPSRAFPKAKDDTHQLGGGGGGEAIPSFRGRGGGRVPWPLAICQPTATFVLDTVTPSPSSTSMSSQRFATRSFLLVPETSRSGLCSQAPGPPPPAAGQEQCGGVRRGPPQRPRPQRRRPHHRRLLGARRPHRLPTNPLPTNKSLIPPSPPPSPSTVTYPTITHKWAHCLNV